MQAAAIQKKRIVRREIIGTLNHVSIASPSSRIPANLLQSLVFGKLPVARPRESIYR